MALRSDEITRACWQIDYMREHEPERLESFMEVRNEAKCLVERYEPFITDKSTPWFITWYAYGNLSLYRSYFLTNVLMRAYHVFDETHRNYYGILEIMKRWDPEWVHSFESRHEVLLENSSRHGIPIYIGTQ